MKSQKKILTTAAILGMIGIILGAFGAHGLKKMVSPEYINIFETAVRYQIYHVFALFAIALAPLTSKQQKSASLFILLGILLFSGSLYLLTFTEVLPFNPKIVGPVTPLGGLCFIIGWSILAFSFYKLKEKQ